MTPTPAPFHGTPVFDDPERSARLAGAFPDLEAVFDRFAKRYLLPGLIFGVVVDGELAYTSGVGMGDLSTGTPPGPDTVFRIASMTKSFTAMCVLMLRDEGLLRLDDPVAEHVPELRALRSPTADSPAVTIRMLLSMSSGLVEDDPWGDRHLGMGAATFMDLLAGGLALDLVPGMDYEYSNLGYAILGRVVANVAGTPLRNLSRQRLFGPLGLTATTWDADLVPTGTAAMGYRRQAGTWVPEPPLPDGAFGAMGGLASSVRDLARYVAFHLSAWPPRDEPDEGPLRRSSVREMAQAHTAGPTYLSAGAAPFSTEGYGYGLVSAVHRRHGRVVAHSGALPGFGSHMEWLPDHGVGIVALANRTYVPVKNVVREAFGTLYSSGGLVPRRIPPSPALLAARASLAQLYERWDPAVAAQAMLDTYFLDLDDDRRAPDLEQLRSRYGACVRLGDITATGALRGSWRMTCEGGTLDVSVTLGPTIPPQLQFVTVVPAGEGGPS